MISDIQANRNLRKLQYFYCYHMTSRLCNETPKPQHRKEVYNEGNSPPRHQEVCASWGPRCCHLNASTFSAINPTATVLKQKVLSKSQLLWKSDYNLVSKMGRGQMCIHGFTHHVHSVSNDTKDNRYQNKLFSPFPESDGHSSGIITCYLYLNPKPLSFNPWTQAHWLPHSESDRRVAQRETLHDSYILTVLGECQTLELKEV